MEYMEEESMVPNKTSSAYSVQTQENRRGEETNNINIGIEKNDDIKNYKQLVQDYYSKAQDLESKNTMLCEHLQEMSEAWEKTKQSKDLALKEKENMTLKFAKGEKKMLNEKDLKEKAEKKCDELCKEIETLQRKLQIKNQEKTRITSIYDNKINELKIVKQDNDRIMNDNCILKSEMKLCQIALKNQAELYKKAQDTIENLNGKIEKFSAKNIEETEHLQHLQLKLEKFEFERDEKDKQLQNKESTPKQYESHDEIIQRLNQLEMKNKDLENDMQLCRVKESELLFFSQQLSEKNVELQSENLNFQTRIKELTDENNELKEQCKRLNMEIAASSKHFTVQMETLSNDKIIISTELDCLKKNLAEQKSENSKLKQELFDQHEEFLIMRKKHNTSLHEFRREIKLSKSNDGIYLSSSSSHLNTSVKDNSFTYNPIGISQPEKATMDHELMQRLTKLQKTSVQKSEQIDFLKDQIESYLLELHRKDKLLQFYFLQEQTDTIVSNEMSDAKFNLSELGGIMASLYNARISDDNLSFELLLEINCKLQAVLEDVLLKNIILKGNIEILGEEIQKLNNQIKQREEI